MTNPAFVNVPSENQGSDDLGGQNFDGVEKERSVLWQVVGLAWDLGYIIALPLVVLALGGRLLDKRFSTSPLFLLVGIFLSLIVTTIGLMRKIKVLNKEMESAGKGQK